MPRVDGTYTAPYPDVVPDTTIESEVHNGTVADLVLDANAPRPITAGGTGASTPSAARDNLDAMVAGAQVINYNSHVFENGSFWSAAGATGARTAGSAFTGVAALVSNDQNYVSLFATDQTTGLNYSRVKNITWGAWVETDLSDKVSKAGDTMTGPLTLPAGNPAALLHAAHKQYVDQSIASAVNVLVGSGSELRFTRSLSQHMTRLFSLAASSQAWTMSMWVKRVSLGTHQSLFGIESTAGAGKLHVGFMADNRFAMHGGPAGADVVATVGPAQTDTTLWLNIVWSAPAGAPASAKFHTVDVNNDPTWRIGVSVAANDLNNAVTHYLGQPGYYPDVIMKEVVFVDGAQLPPAKFGESVTGVWTPKVYPGPFGANGFKLFFNSPDLGEDATSHNNDWTAVNF